MLSDTNTEVGDESFGEYGPGDDGSSSGDDGGDDPDLPASPRVPPPAVLVAPPLLPPPPILAPAPPPEPGVGSEDAPAAKGKGKGRGRGGGDRYDRFVAGCGYVTINSSNQSLDGECGVCGASKDKKWHARKGARSDVPLAQGRPLGSLFAWLNLPGGCPGGAEVHRAFWPTLEREERIKRRRHFRANYDYTPCFERKRPQRDEEGPDGEPPAPP